MNPSTRYSWNFAAQVLPSGLLGDLVMIAFEAFLLEMVSGIFLFTLTRPLNRASHRRIANLTLPTIAGTVLVVATGGVADWLVENPTAKWFLTKRSHRPPP